MRTYIVLRGNYHDVLVLTVLSELKLTFYLVYLSGFISTSDNFKLLFFKNNFFDLMYNKKY